eukprot:CAMPEP_0170566960 /NCGR_PEP_ID=MMETSP0211-20121228/80174_1 /TAXON_ID=311385 /ORGANISM="Pseudokeronopsis sp., Strain OXSARD2" /LENGTH=130 /DNA_ID=CAMNT_0010888281 /DNA_START=637 /DNA_END=1029 /DNA_ORIENTATION=-
MEEKNQRPAVTCQFSLRKRKFCKDNGLIKEDEVKQKILENMEKARDLTILDQLDSPKRRKRLSVGEPSKQSLDFTKFGIHSHQVSSTFKNQIVNRSVSQIASKRKLMVKHKTNQDQCLEIYKGQQNLLMR